MDQVGGILSSSIWMRAGDNGGELVGPEYVLYESCSIHRRRKSQIDQDDFGRLKYRRTVILPVNWFTVGTIPRRGIKGMPRLAIAVQIIAIPFIKGIEFRIQCCPQRRPRGLARGQAVQTFAFAVIVAVAVAVVWWSAQTGMMTGDARTAILDRPTCVPTRCQSGSS